MLLMVDDKDMVVQSHVLWKISSDKWTPQSPGSKKQRQEDRRTHSEERCKLKWQVSGSVTVGFVLLQPSQLILFRTRGWTLRAISYCPFTGTPWKRTRFIVNNYPTPRVVGLIRIPQTVGPRFPGPRWKSTTLRWRGWWGALMSITMILVSSLLLPTSSEYFRFHCHSGFWLAYMFERLPACGKSRFEERKHFYTGGYLVGWFFIIGITFLHVIGNPIRIYISDNLYFSFFGVFVYRTTV